MNTIANRRRNESGIAEIGYLSIMFVAGLIAAAIIGWIAKDSTLFVFGIVLTNIVVLLTIMVIIFLRHHPASVRTTR